MTPTVRPGARAAGSEGGDNEELGRTSTPSLVPDQSENKTRPRSRQRRNRPELPRAQRTRIEIEWVIGRARIVRRTRTQTYQLPYSSVQDERTEVQYFADPEVAAAAYCEQRRQLGLRNQQFIVGYDNGQNLWFWGVQVTDAGLRSLRGQAAQRCFKQHGAIFAAPLSADHSREFWMADAESVRA
jgi:hypothetical protein